MVAEGAREAGLGGWGVGKGRRVRSEGGVRSEGVRSEGVVIGQEVAMLVGGFVKVLVKQVKPVKY